MRASIFYSPRDGNCGSNSHLNVNKNETEWLGMLRDGMPEAECLIADRQAQGSTPACEGGCVNAAHLKRVEDPIHFTIYC